MSQSSELESSKLPMCSAPVANRSRVPHHRWHALALAALILVTGCSGTNESESTSTGPTKKVTVRVLLIDDDQLASTVERLWTAEDRGELEISHMTSAEFSETSNRPEADVIIYPSILLGEMMLRNTISQLPEHVAKDDQFKRTDVFSLDRLVTASWADQPIGFSLGSPQFVLLYRKDIFEELGLVAPTTWEEYASAAATIRAHLEQAPDADRMAVAEPLSGDWASRMLLLRAASYVKHPSRYSDIFDLSTMAPLVDRAPFVRSLNEMHSVLGDSHEALSQLDADEVTDLIFDDQCVMAISLIRPSDAREFNESELSDQIGLAAAPGSTEVFSFSRDAWESRNTSKPANVPLLGVDGRVASVIYLSRRTAAAQEFILWLAGPDSSGKVLTRSKHSAPFRRSHLAKINAWVDPRLSEEASADYAGQLERTMQQTLWLTEPRVPGGPSYVAILAEAIRDVFAESNSSQDALTLAATKSREVNEAYGISEQRGAYEASLQLK